MKKKYLIILIGIILFSCGGSGGGKKADPISTVSSPVFSPAGGTYDYDINIAISSDTSGAVIYYTTDGSEPTTSSSIYSSPVSITGAGSILFLKAIAVKSGMEESYVSSTLYQRTATPDSSGPSGTFTINNNDLYTISLTVTLNMNITDAAEMRFSNDNILWSDWEVYSATKSWTLSSIRGRKAVYAQFKDISENLFQTNSSITHFLEEKKTASDGATSDMFGGKNNITLNGSSITVSNDGTIIAVGTFSKPIGTASGSVYIYRWNSESWIEHQLTPSNPSNNLFFGFSVSLSNDGNMIAIGTLNGSALGYAYVFIWDNANQKYGLWNSGTSHWDENQRVTPSDAGYSPNSFGLSVSLSVDGNSLLIGSYHDSQNGTNAGAAYFYKWNAVSQKFGVWNSGSSHWDENQKITPTDPHISDLFGFHVAVSNDSKTIIIGALYADGLQTDSGTVYVYKWNESNLKYGIWNVSTTHWDENQKLYASDGVGGDWFGRYVALSSSGDSILITASKADISSKPDQGAAYLFKWNGSTYTQTKKFTASDGDTGDYYGFSASISGNGNRVLIGSVYDTIGSNTNQGSAYLYDWDGSIWLEKKIIVSDGLANDCFGYSTGLSLDGYTTVISSPGAEIGARADQGAIYIY